jgi:hypothetical protein
MKKKTKKIIWISVGSFFGLVIICFGVLFLIAYGERKKGKEKKESYLPLLQNANGYNKVWDVDAPQFTYQQINDSNLVRVRTHFNLDSIAGNGDEISQIKNLMYYLHDIVFHQGQNNPLENVNKNAIDLIDYCRKENVGMNCRHLAIALNEFYLSMGIPSRFITCLPKDSTDMDCHVINSVYSKDLNKWIWMDPTFAAYVTDENNQLLSIEEVRYRLINNLPLVLNEDANWNHQTKQTKAYYLETYMAKNLYWIECLTDSKYASESGKMTDRQYVRLCPEAYKGFNFKVNDYITNNPQYFWQNPGAE